MCVTHIIRIAGYGGQFGASVAFVIIVARAELRLLACDGQTGKVNGNGGHGACHSALCAGTDAGRVGVASKADLDAFSGASLQLLLPASSSSRSRLLCITIGFSGFTFLIPLAQTPLAATFLGRRRVVLQEEKEEEQEGEGSRLIAEKI